MGLPWDFSRIDADRVHLDLLRPDDLEALHRLQSDPEVCRYMMYEPRTREQVRRVIADVSTRAFLADDGDDLQPAIRAHDGTLLGTLYVKLTSAADAQAELGWLLDPRAQGRGYASEAASAMLDVLFRDAGIHRVHAQLDPRNAASVALCRRLGMRHEAHFVEDLWFKGAWGDTAVFAILAREWAAARRAD
jgi:RimJ/RimL family protein N-acetyltransferase